MVNRSLSNLGIRLDNFGAKPLKTHQHKMRMVGPGGLEPPTNRLWGESPDVIFRLDFLVRKSVHAIRA